MKQLSLQVLAGQYTIHRFSPESGLPVEVLDSSFLSITKTADELSIVCDAEIGLESEQSESDWSCIKVLGPLDFSLTGILAKLSGVLAEADISLFAISTYDTDYILVKTNKLNVSIEKLKNFGYIFDNF
jgi:hypothetical protein